MPLTSYYTALTGINNNSIAINVIGDNLANMNTVAFKGNNARFSELLAGSSGTDATGNPISFGLGATLNGITRNTAQGTINYTGNSTDAAINGNGFFVVSVNGGQGYTRAGNFQLDRSGNLITADGFQLMGYMGVDGEINANGGITPIEIRMGELMPANATTTLSVTANLDARAEDGDTFSSPVQIYDSLGGAHTVTLTFARTGAGQWSWSATLPPEDINGSTAPIGNGVLTFDGDGILTDPATNPTLSIPAFTSGASAMDVTFGLWNESGNPIVTGYSSDSATSRTVQDGYASSALMRINIDSSGVIMGLTENGQSIPLAQLALANFPNVQGLERYQGSTFAAFTSAGEPSIGTAGTGGRGSITGSSLEQSNVDMAQEFINLIVAQRAYQANSRVITTTDELYQESLNLKR